MLKTTLTAATLALASLHASACYVVYDRANRVVYNAQTTPVDLSRDIHETLPSVFPGGHMVFDMATDCPLTNQLVPAPMNNQTRPGMASARVPVMGTGNPMGQAGAPAAPALSAR